MTVSIFDNFLDSLKIFKRFIIYILFVSLVAIISYYVIGIYILVDEFSIFETFRNNCDSKIWYYILVSMIAFLDKFFLRNLESLYEFLKIYCLLLFIEIVLVIFGGTQLFKKECINNNYDYQDTKMFIYGLFNFIIQIMFSCFFGVKIGVIIKNKKKNNNSLENFDTNDLSII